MLAAILCHVNPTREADRLNLRAQHLAYVATYRNRIFPGGPTLSPSGSPETMIIIVESADLADADQFIREEPYTSGLSR